MFDKIYILFFLCEVYIGLWVFLVLVVVLLLFRGVGVVLCLWFVVGFVFVVFVFFISK